MECMIDIKKEGNTVLAYLPFNPKIEFGILKGSIYVKCVINGVEFKSKLMSRGSGKYCIFFNKQLLKLLDLDGDEHLAIPLTIILERENIHELAELKMLDNETLKSIRERSSIRCFTGKQIDEVTFHTILNAELCAPSASNKRPFHIVVTQDRDKMICISKNNNYAKMLQCATACIVVCGDKIVQGIPEWLLADCSAATQNMLLAIHSLGLGGVWCGVRQGSDFYKDIVNVFGLPSHIKPISLIAFGYTDDKKVQSNRYEANKIHFESW